MNFKEKKEYLEGYIRCVNHINGLYEELERWEAIGQSITQKYNAGGASGGGSSSKVETAGISMVTITRDIQVEIATAKQYRDLIQKVIAEKSAKMRYAEILTYKYINGLSNAKIARMIKKDEKTVRHILNVAVDTLDI